MAIVPNTNIGKITFYEAHIPVWSATPTIIGLVAADCTALSALIGSARKEYDTQQAALYEARNATQRMKDAVRAMHALGSADIAKIKAFAEATNNPTVYTSAVLPPPATPSPVGPPGTPFEFVVTLLQTGAINLRWKCSNPTGASGTVYEVARRVGGDSVPFTLVGAIGVREFEDATIARGSSSVTYRVQAVRSTSRGNPAQFTVSFGVGGNGLMVATVSEVTTETAPGGETRLAA
jgi:hypothetical protein